MKLIFFSFDQFVTAGFVVYMRNSEIDHGIYAVDSDAHVLKRNATVLSNRVAAIQLASHTLIS